MTVLVTGGAGFIGVNFILQWLRDCDEPVVNLDKLTYAGNLKSLTPVLDNPRHNFVRGDIADSGLVAALLQKHRPRAVIHFAAESHVDRSVHDPERFVATNVVGMSRLLEAVRSYYEDSDAAERDRFRFLNVSTDEVFGSVAPDERPFTEKSPYAPSSPYAASKAAADHLARSYYRTYGVPVITSNCSNNYGPYQFPEKLIPLMILNGLSGNNLPVYGDGKHVRDWLYVSDHCRALRELLDQGSPGETYNIGGGVELTNIEVVRAICKELDTATAGENRRPHEELITFVEDRPGHDRRYAIDSGKIEAELGWRPAESFSSALKQTVRWYIDNQKWVDNVRTGDYVAWIETNYGHRAIRA